MTGTERAPLSVELDDLHLAGLAARYIKAHDRVFKPAPERIVSPLTLVLHDLRGKKLARSIGAEYDDVKDLLPDFATRLVMLAGDVHGR